jgi:hypothetical protein
MALFMDMHDLKAAVALDDVAKAHAADLATQDAYGVHYLRYWVDEGDGRIFCLVDAPTKRPPRPCTALRTDWSPTRSTRSPRATDILSRLIGASAAYGRWLTTSGHTPVKGVGDVTRHI